MERHNGFFTPDEVDEQIEQLLRSTQPHILQEPASSETDMKLMRHLSTFYQEEGAASDQRSLERVGALLQQSEGLIFDRDDDAGQLRPRSSAAMMPEIHPTPLSRKHRIWPRRINKIAAVALLTLLIGSMALVFNLAHSSKNSTADNTDAFVYRLLQNSLYKLDLQHKKVAWSTSVKTDGYEPDRIAEYNGIVYIGTSLSDINGKVYTEIPYVSAYNAQTGALLWRTKLDAKSFDNIDLGFISQPVVANGRVYVISDGGKIYALDALTGNRRWVYDTHEIVMVCPGVPGSRNYNCGAVIPPNITVGSDGAVYASVVNHLFALNGINGSKLWATSLNLGQYVNGMAYIDGLVSSAGNLYVTSSEFYFDDLALRRANLYAFNAKTGQQRWFISKLSGGFGTPIIANGVAYIGSFEGTIYAFRVGDGLMLWQRSLGGQLGIDLSVSKGVIYVQADILKRDGSRKPVSSTLAAFNASDGSLRWQRSIDTHGALPDDEVVSGGVIYLAIFVYPPPKSEKNRTIAFPGHFVIDAYSTLDGHKL